MAEGQLSVLREGCEEGRWRKRSFHPRKKQKQTNLWIRSRDKVEEEREEAGRGN